MKSIIIAAPHSGAGKTTVTLGIMECLKRRGLSVAPFKVGPDFIDPGYHRLITGRPSINLDGWMCRADFVRDTFRHHAEGADISVVEGVMGLFDGVSGVQDTGSTAQIARIIGAPVLLVVDAKSQAGSAAALVKGFVEYDPRVRVAGVIFNNVGSDLHGQILREAVEHLGTGIKVLGCLPRDEQLHIPSRHLGLMTVEDNPLPLEYLDHLAQVVRSHLDLGLLWAVAIPHSIEQSLPLWGSGHDTAQKSLMAKHDHVAIAVARDEAFCFVYEDNLRLLREAGAEIVEFSPLRDAGLPEGTNGIYLPGGYPELYAGALAVNASMLAMIREKIEDGMPAYAECGGFIYLTQGVMKEASGEPVQNCDPVAFPGVFPVTTRLLPRRKALGYREVTFTVDSILGPSGTVARGHEFHYTEMEPMPESIRRCFQVSRNGVDHGAEGYCYRNCLASYIHLHFGSSPGLAAALVKSCRDYKQTGKG